MGGHDDPDETHLDGLQLARADAVELHRGSVLAGRYEIEATLGRGGAGVVLRAYDRELREAVAIKVLRPDLAGSARWIERLAREVKLARQLRHPNVCRVFDFEKADGHVFIVMELATGGTLRRELEEGIMARRPLEARLSDARAVAAGLAAIHEAGIAHRDVTPQNVLRMADGRLIVSDFGLATEVSQATTSLHGGTLAYMAPEVVRGQRGTFASDVWALGVVIHEIVFGERPTWSKPVGGALMSPAEDRTLARGERVALSVCRVCTSEDPGQRPRAARDVEAWIGERRLVRAPHVVKRTVALGLGLLVLGGIAVVVHDARRARPAAPPATAERQEIAVTGEPADWTKTSKVLATVEGRVQCLVMLPDPRRRTLRLLWGKPPHAEDLDIATGTRTPAPLAPAAYAEGCPDLSPDGKRLLYQGYATDGRPFAFVSPTPDGRDAMPVVPTADPSMASEPRWLADGAAFSLDVDGQHMGVFSMTSNRLTILPEPVHEPYFTSFRSTWRERVYVSAVIGRAVATEWVGTTWPTLEEEMRFRLPDFVMELVTRDGRTFIGSTRASGSSVTILEIDPAARQARRLGSMPGSNPLLRHLTLVGSDLVFASIEPRFDAWSRRADGTQVRLTNDGLTTDAVRCGRDFLVARWDGTGNTIWRLSGEGKELAKLPTKGTPGAMACSPDGASWFYSELTEHPGIYRCGEPTACRIIHEGAASGIAISPGGERLAFSDVNRGVAFVKWMPSAGGGPVREVSENEGQCTPEWSSEHTLWVSRRRGHQPIWTEVDVETGKATGRERDGPKTCLDGVVDPQFPGSSNPKIVEATRSEIRLQPNVAPAR